MEEKNAMDLKESKNVYIEGVEEQKGRNMMSFSKLEYMIFNVKED